MSEEINTPQPEEQEIDLLELAGKVWAGRKLIFITCGVAVVLGIVVAFSIPREFATSVTMAPETGSKSGSGGMGALASMAGINLNSSTGEDALSPELYPDIVKSTPFLIDLFNVKVTTQKGNLRTTLYEYMDKHQKAPWWGAVMGTPMKAVGGIISLFKPAEKKNRILAPKRSTHLI